MKTYNAKPAEIVRGWYVVDLEGQSIGRAAAKVAAVLRGKHRPIYTPHVDTGEYVIAVNADKVVFTGNKIEQKVYYRHSGYVGGLKETTAKRMMDETPEEAFKHAVKGMLPKNTLGREMFAKLKVYKGDEHPHAAQQPKKLEL